MDKLDKTVVILFVVLIAVAVFFAGASYTELAIKNLKREIRHTSPSTHRVCDCSSQDE